MSAFSASGISVSFGGVLAVVDVDVEVEPGQLVGLIGPNGAGKTTFIDAVTGFVPHRGRVEIGGRDVTALAPFARTRAGLSRTWQATELFDDLSVRENLNVAADHRGARHGLRQLFRPSGTWHDAVDEAIERVGLADFADALPSELTQGTRKLVSVARALAARPKLLLLDEPAAGLDAHESGRLGDLLRRVVDQGTPILLVDHDMGLVLRICDQIVALEFGQVIGRGTPSEIRRDERVITAYLGAAAKELSDETGAGL